MLTQPTSADVEERDLYHREGDPPGLTQGDWRRPFAVAALIPLVVGLLVILLWLVLR